MTKDYLWNDCAIHNYGWQLEKQYKIYEQQRNLTEVLSERGDVYSAFTQILE